jgi:hypothetical protein
MNQTCTISCTKSCINHVPKPIPYHVPNLYQIMHQPKPVPYHVQTPYHASTMYLTMHQCHQGMPHTYTENVSQTMCQISKMLLKPCALTIYHITHDMSQSFHTPCTSTKCQTNNIIYQVYASTMHIRCASSMCQCLNNILKTCLKHAP